MIILLRAADVPRTFQQHRSIPAVTAPQYCRPVLLTQQTLRPYSARAGQTARHAIDRTPSRRLRRVANRETQAGYRAQVGLGREGNEDARASFAGISIPLRAGPVIPVCGSAQKTCPSSQKTCPSST